jgi:hypothetical protein
LKQLINSNYDYFIVCDSEIDIIPENFTNDNISEKINNIFNNKYIYAGDTKGVWVNNITSTSADLFFEDEYKKLKYITNNFQLYFWWSDIPVYKRTHLKSFFEKINYTNIIPYHFDHIIYQFFLLLTEEFQIINTTPITNSHWSLEELRTNDINILNKLSETKYGFGWITKRLYELNPNYFISKKTFFVYHLDRLNRE